MTSQVPYQKSRVEEDEIEGYEILEQIMDYASQTLY